MSSSAVACTVLALAAVVAPGPAGSVRLAGLHGPVAAGRRSRALPATAAAVLGAVAGLLALGPAGALAGGAATAAWHHRRVRVRAERTDASTAAELADALGRIVDELRAGSHPAAALAGVRADGPLARAALEPAATAAALGDGVPAALAAQAGGRPGAGPDLGRVARAWALAERHGVPLADLLAGVHGDMRWRVAHAARVRAQLAGPRATAAVLTALPLLGVGLGQLVGADPLDVLRSGVLGQLLVAAGVGFAAAGASWTGRILRAAVPR